MLLVVHVPKTAGTSFRRALEKYFGPDNIVRDYGHNLEATTEIVRNHLYGPEEFKPKSELVETISAGSNKVLIGHFPVSKYVDYFEPQNIIGFMRDPLIRTCSEFMHRKRNNTYDGSFSEFMHEDNIQNIQVRYLSGMPEGSMIGLTERYSESLRYINKVLQIGLSDQKYNIDKKGGGQKFAERLSQHELDLFKRLNKEELELYQYATERFDALEIPGTAATRLFDWWKRS